MSDQPPPSADPAHDWSDGLPGSLTHLADGVYDQDLAAKGSVYQAGVPQALAAAVRHAGVDVSFGDYVAICGWASGFAYRYGTIEPAFMAIRASEGEGRWQVFRIIDWLGLDYEGCPTAEKDRLWSFVIDHVDSGVPLVSEHVDGGLILGYREREGKREVWFNGDPGFGWTDIDVLHPFEAVALIRSDEPLDGRELAARALERVLHYAWLEPEDETLNGIEALSAYARDVAEPARTFDECCEYFCWATFNRLDTRRCLAGWLTQTSRAYDGEASSALAAAADLYGEAAEYYHRYRLAVGGGVQDADIDPRDPDTIRAAVALLEHGIAAERGALEQIAEAVGYSPR